MELKGWLDGTFYSSLQICSNFMASASVWEKDINRIIKSAIPKQFQ
jgi:hypothetical protein